MLFALSATLAGCGGAAHTSTTRSVSEADVTVALDRQKLALYCLRHLHGPSTRNVDLGYEAVRQLVDTAKAHPNDQPSGFSMRQVLVAEQTRLEGICSSPDLAEVIRQALVEPPFAH